MYCYRAAPLISSKYTTRSAFLPFKFLATIDCLSAQIDQNENKTESPGCNSLRVEIFRRSTLYPASNARVLVTAEPDPTPSTQRVVARRVISRRVRRTV